MLLLKNPQGANALFLSQHEEIFNFLFENVYCENFKLEEFIFETANDGENLFYYLAKYGTASMLKKVSDKLMEELSYTKFMNLLKFKNKAQENIFHAAATQNKSAESLTFLLSELNKDDVKKLLMENDENYLIPLQSVVMMNRPDQFKILFKFYQNNFSEREVVSIFLMAEKKSGKKLLLMAKDPDIVALMIEFLERNQAMMMILTMEQLIMQRTSGEQK